MEDLEPVTNLLQGHRVRSGTSCRQIYDNEEPQELLLEQERVFPNGPLGWLCAVRVESSGLPSEVTDLVTEFMRGAVPLMDFADRMELPALRSRTEDRPPAFCI